MSTSVPVPTARHPVLVIGVDLGTSSVKVVVLESRGKVVASVTQAYPTYRPQPGWVIQHAADWWQALQLVFMQLHEQGVKGEQVAAVGLSGQMHGLVLLDAHGEVLGPCQIWADERCSAEVHAIEQHIGRADLLTHTGSWATTSATAAKLLWVRRHEPELWHAVSHVVLPKDYLRWRLTGMLATDPSDASGTLLCDLAQREWSPTLLHALGIPPMLLPPIYESSAITGTLLPSVAQALGLTAGIPVIAGGGDTLCAALGAGVIGNEVATPHRDIVDTLTGGHDPSGMALATLGSGGQFVVASNQPLIDRGQRLQTFCHVVAHRWLLLGGLLSGAAALDWLVKLVAPDIASGPALPDRAVVALLTEAAAIAPGAEGVLFVPHLQGSRLPRLANATRGAFVGLRPEHGRGVLVRAVVEGVALALREYLEAARTLGLPIQRVRLAGGANRHLLWQQVQAAAFNLPVVISPNVDVSAVGAALLAGVGVGIWSTLPVALEVITQASAATEIMTPDPVAVARYHTLAPIAQRLTRDLQPTFAALTESHMKEPTGSSKYSIDG